MLGEAHTPIHMTKILFLVLMLLILPKVPIIHAEEEILDEEVKSTIPSDPEMRGKKHRAPKPVKTEAPKPAAKTKAPETPAPSPATDALEEAEWKTMRSEKKTSAAPKAPAVKVDEKDKKIPAGKISFKSNSDLPTAESSKVIKQVAQYLQKNTGVKIRIEGHSDSVGSDQANLERSERRADQVKEFLVKEGVAAERLEAVGMGDKYPVASSVTPEGQEKNRRVEFHVVGGLSTEGTTPPSAEPPPPSPPPASPESMKMPEPRSIPSVINVQPPQAVNPTETSPVK